MTTTTTITSAPRRPPAVQASGPPARLPDRLLLAAGAGIGVAGVLLFLLPLRGVVLGRMNGLGLISVLPIASLAGLGLLVSSFMVLLARPRPSKVVLSALLVALVFCLDGVTGLIEPLPRFATAYQVSGFVNYISQTGHVTPSLTAYFSWPGFLAMISFVAGAAGVHSLLPLMTWWPVVVDLLVLVPFLLLTRALRMNWRARWFAALLFSLGNWVGQDYFSPQSLNYLLYLVFLAVILTWFSVQFQGGQPQRTGQRKPGGRVPGELPASYVARPLRALLLLLLIAIFVVSTLSHQLTPFLLIAACAGLVLVRRCTPRGLPILFAVIAIGWISYGTVAYWSGHLSTVFGDFGHLGGTVSASVSSRVIGTPIHQLVDKTRIGLAGLMAVMAIAGLVRRWRGGITDRALIVLLIAPVTIAGLQNYGGEISLRVYLFALPAAAILAAFLFFPGVRSSQTRGRATAGGLGVADLGVRKLDLSRLIPSSASHGLAPGAHGATAVDANGTVGRPGGRLPAALALVVAGLVAVALSGLFVVARYGNEAFERIPPGEYAAMNYIYDHAVAGTPVLWLSRPSGVNATPQMPWQFRDIAKVDFVSAASPRDPAAVKGVVGALRGLGPGGYLITTSTESTFVSQTAGFPVHWDGRLRAALKDDPQVREAFETPTAAVYQARHPIGPPKANAQGTTAATSSGGTIWSLIGIGALVAAMLLLATREFIRECVPARRWLLAPLAIACLPVLALLLYAVAERFVVLS